ncbi:MAG: hypothetical protein BAA01_01590 [Bacillus thermozeamaize]|uniref:Uncharacterized protein n=1 Tax=Bacillus thermozeamaize TaxID=230954 RepID=A0A1Y3PIW1_9BACI|nr:MAG: hypothetical protein BAA01_01590 [Bacillus thermozeamaize]
MRLKHERNARDNRLLALIPTVPASYMGIHSAMMNMFRTLGFALGPTLAAMAWCKSRAWMLRI